LQYGGVHAGIYAQDILRVMRRMLGLLMSSAGSWEAVAGQFAVCARTHYGGGGGGLPGTSTNLRGVLDHFFFHTRKSFPL